MKKRIYTTGAVAVVAATLVATLSPQTGISGATGTGFTTAASTSLKPPIATTLGEPIKVTAELTPSDIAAARQRVQDGLVKPANPQAKTRPEHRKPPKAAKKSLADFMKEARSFATEAKKHPYKDPESVKPAATEALAMAPVNAVTHNYTVGTTPPSDLESMCFGTTAEQYIFFFDRYTSCMRVPFTIDYWEVDPTTGAKIDHHGTSSARMEIFTQNYTDNRSTRMFARVQKGSASYDWGWFDNLGTAPGVYLSLIGQCEQAVTPCSATSGPATMTWGSWDNNTDWLHWDTNSPTDVSYGRDKLGAHYAFMEAYTDTDEYQTPEPAKTPAHSIRCDSAAYFTSGRPSTCVFLEPAPRLEYSTAAGSPHREVAQHIKDAFANPNSTYPTSQYTKVIPGEYDGTWNQPGLHRLTASLHQAQMDANTAHKDGACQQTGEYATTGLPIWYRPQAGYQDCDEFPFRSSLEGAASPNWDFSVRAVDSTQNQSAGASLNNFYGWDRVLAWDANLPYPESTNDGFYVQIHDF